MKNSKQIAQIDLKDIKRRVVHLTLDEIEDLEFTIQLIKAAKKHNQENEVNNFIERN